MAEQHTPMDVALAAQVVIGKIIQSLSAEDRRRIADNLRDWIDHVDQSQKLPYKDCSMPSVHDLVTRIYQDTYSE